ncbi:cytochrome P450 [Streptomyces sp. CNQ085]|uniref:cytochrome P450 n=1 Tax=Streptomyces sp. CNQ085 TaxID=2886944 RepID=UPI001F50D34A|nr:cytochrome P450 [Streptomyces sp. CNQ085]MCI0383316.1 cytochrome P450 [Streptomyces sp. CNQ085]
MTAAPHRPRPDTPPGPPVRPGRTRHVPLYGPGLDGDGLPALYERLRVEHGPVAPVALAPGARAWLVMGYGELLRVARREQEFSHDPRHWRLVHEGRVTADSPLLAFFGWRPALMFADGWRHRRMRAAVADALGRVDDGELGRLVRETADRLIDSFTGRHEADLVPHYAHRLPARVVARLLGADEQVSRRLAEAVAGTAAANADSPHAGRRLERLLLALLREKRRAPGPDLASWLLTHPASLREEEVLHNLVVTVVAAHQATKNWIATTLRLLLTDPALRSSLDGGCLTVDEALDLVLWRFPPTQNFPGRYALRDVRLGRQEVRAGDMLVLGLAAANEDPEVLPACGRPVTGNRAHMAFGAGPHVCPAQPQARLIARTAVEVLRRRLPGLRLAVPEERLAWTSSPWTSGLAALPVRFTAPWSAAEPTASRTRLACGDPGDRRRG